MIKWPRFQRDHVLRQVLKVKILTLCGIELLVSDYSIWNPSNSCFHRHECSLSGRWLLAKNVFFLAHFLVRYILSVCIFQKPSARSNVLLNSSLLNRRQYLLTVVSPPLLLGHPLLPRLRQFVRHLNPLLYLLELILVVLSVREGTRFVGMNGNLRVTLDSRDQYFFLFYRLPG